MPNTETFPTAKHVADALEGTPEPVGLADALKWCDNLTRSDDLEDPDRSAIATVLEYLSELGKDARALRAALKAERARMDWLSRFETLEGDTRVRASDGLPAAMFWDWDSFDGGTLRDAVDGQIAAEAASYASA